MSQTPPLAGDGPPHARRPRGRSPRPGHARLVAQPRHVHHLCGGQGWSYRQTANYGHFGRDDFPWERTGRAAALRAAAGLKG